jgi:myosin heavy subunit
VLPASASDPDVRDHCNLEVLNDATLLDATRARFRKDAIYTYISEILLAVNPLKPLPHLYDLSSKALYRSGSRDALDPHIYGVAELAFSHLVAHSHSQSLVVSGESGAGKTEANKQLLDYLIWRAGTADATANGSNGNGALGKRILDTNPVLEAFGNAKTARNHNSSRFGKYLHLKMDDTDHSVVGGHARKRKCARNGWGAYQNRDAPGMGGEHAKMETRLEWVGSVHKWGGAQDRCWLEQAAPGVEYVARKRCRLE